MKNRLLGALLALFVLSGGDGAIAQTPPPPPPTSWYPPAAITPVSLSVTGTTGSVALPALPSTYPVITIVNNGVSEIFCRAGGSSVTAATNAYTLAVPPNAYRALWDNASTYVACITATGTATARITQSNGAPQIGFLDSGGGTSGGSVNAGTTPNGAYYAASGSAVSDGGSATVNFGGVSVAGNLVITQGGSGITAVVTTPIALTNGGSTFGIAASETMVMPSGSIASTVGIGFRNDLTITGNGSHVTSSQDLLSGNFTTTWGSSTIPITGTVQTSGGFQAGDYISAYAAGAVFAYQRTVVVHNQLLSNATVNEWDDFQPFINNNYGTITLHITYHCTSDQGIPGGGTITTDDCLKNDDANRAIVTAGPVDFADGSIFAPTSLTLATQLLGKSNSGSTAPSYSFADNTGAGIYDSGTGAAAGINYAINGSRVYGMNSNQFFNGAQSTGFEIQSGAQGAVIFVPDRANGACGVGASALGNVSTWACNGGGSGILAWDVAYNGLSANQPFVTQVLGEAATGALPAFSFSDNTGTGIGDSNTGTGMNFSISGMRAYGMNATQFFVNNMTGPELFNTSATSSIAIAPNRSAQNAGINSSVAGNVTINASNGTGGGSVTSLDIAYNLINAEVPIELASSTTGVGAQTFTNSPCTGLTSERWIPFQITGQSGTWYMPACQ